MPLRALLTFLVPIPLTLFFNKAKMIGRLGQAAAVLLLSVTFVIFVLTPFLGHSHRMDVVNNSVTMVALTCFVISLWQHRQGGEMTYATWGFGTFIASAFFDNLVGLRFENAVHIEPIGMTIFISALGYVSLRRAFIREEKLISLESELELARRIQQSILPTGGPTSPAFHVAARYLPMTDVAGDFYDYVVNEHSRLAILIADVSGHGIPAALIASMVKLAAASHRDEAAHPSVVLSKMNKSLCGNTQSQFVTAGLVHLDSETNRIHYSGAAHPPMLRLRAGEVVDIQENGLMLAAFNFADYQTVQHDLQPGDRFLLYTDGIIEAANAEDEFFGIARVKSELLKTAALDINAAADMILSQVKAWHTRQDDDLTLILCEYQSPSLGAPHA
ncbi:MAG: hypothetical protein NVS9B15_08690 [Acidobacteriaceae bacterium]